MATPPLPPELERLERELASRPPGGPPAGLRGRVLDAVAAELRRPARDTWVFAAKVAAAALLLINLSFSATAATDYELRPSGRDGSGDAMAAQIRQLLPEIPRQEALRQARLLRAGMGIVPCPRSFPGAAAPAGAADPNNLIPQGD